MRLPSRFTAWGWAARTLAVFLWATLIRPLVPAAPLPDRSTLHVAAQTGDVSAVVASLQAGAAPDGVDWTNETPLLKAARFGRTDVVATLLQAGAMAQVQHSLPVAARYGHASVLRLLLEAGADPDVADRRIRYDTPLMIASTYGQTDAVRVLLDGNARANAHNAAERTALICAAMEGHTDTVATLLSGGAKVDLPDKSGYTPLIFASNGGHLGVVQVLLDNGASVDRSTYDTGSTALIVASMQGSLAVVNLLIGAGGDPNARKKRESSISLYADARRDACLKKSFCALIAFVPRKQRWGYSDDGSSSDRTH